MTDPPLVPSRRRRSRDSRMAAERAAAVDMTISNANLIRDEVKLLFRCALPTADRRETNTAADRREELAGQSAASLQKSSWNVRP